MSAVMTTAAQDAAEMRGIDQRARQEVNKRIELKARFMAVMNGLAFSVPFVSYAGGNSAHIREQKETTSAVMSELVDHEELVMVILRESTCPLVAELKAKMADAYAQGQYLEQVMVERGEL